MVRRGAGRREHAPSCLRSCLQKVVCWRALKPGLFSLSPYVPSFSFLSKSWPAMDAGADNTPLVAAPDESREDDIDVALHRLEGFLCLLGFPDSSSQARIAASWAAFLLLGVAVPSATIFLAQCSPSVCEEYKVEQFELCVLLSEVSLAAVSLVCISHNLLKYGIRRFLFVDQHHGHVQRFQKEYVRKIQADNNQKNRHGQRN